ncbi:MAG: carbamoyltransferase HypF [Candidatus Dormibacteria bacterium]
MAAPAGAPRRRRRLTVHGIVQGVGFRPHVWRLARDHGLAGYVRNTSGGVVIEIEGEERALARFTVDLSARAPTLARIERVETHDMAARGEEAFRIVESVPVAGEHQPLSPDAATCDDCLAEMRDPGDRRHRHPFINCTNCGPRFTIIEDIPYDRPLTTMRRFDMCERCRREYEDPGDRRFHAQPIACPGCGPTLWFADPQGARMGGDPLAHATAALSGGHILAIKGLGGFQLACDAADTAAVGRLRERKRRPSKPLAVMVRDLAAVRRLCHVDGYEAAALTAPARPIVLLRRRELAAECIATDVAPHIDQLGVMLPYTPLHHLLLEEIDRPLVMTSGNVSEEPIARENGEALARLSPLADGFLLHDRDIHARYDDSVARVVDSAVRVVRRARGYCPLPIPVDAPGRGPILALGAHLKNTFCIVTGGQAFVGPHIGDLDHPLSLRHQAEALETYLRLFRARPETIACDLHPDYASTRLAEERSGGQPVRVQHHHAHIASVMAEHGLRGALLGVAFDGTGYGPDGTVWGGEFLICDERGYQRAAHLMPVPQPGGDRCAREGWRMAAAYSLAAGLDTAAPPPGAAPWVDERRWRLVGRLAHSELAPLSSSAGRLFDATASLLGIAHVSSFEAEAAMRLEALADGVDPASVGWITAAVVEGPVLRVDTPGVLRDLVKQRDAGRPVTELAAVFHETLARTITHVCRRLAAQRGLGRVALSGGVFQNALLLTRTAELLREGGLDVYSNRLVPANDGGISLGQALVAASTIALPAHRETPQ